MSKQCEFCGYNLISGINVCDHCSGGKHHTLVRYDDPMVYHRCPLIPAKAGDAGLDLCNAGPSVVLRPSESRSIPAGVSVKVPEGWVGLIKPRSSTFIKRGLFVLESVIDSGYTGPMFAVVWNPGVMRPDSELPNDVTIQPYERLAQLVIVPFKQIAPRQIFNTFPTTDRGSTGFGSTGA